MTTKNPYRKVVLKGATEVLDVHAPGWERKVDLSNLDMSNGSQCICGQVFMDKVTSFLAPLNRNGYGWALMNLSTLETRVKWGLNYGFTVYTEDSLQTERRSWSLLAEAWVELIKHRFDTGTLSG